MELQQINSTHSVIGYAESRIGGRPENQDTYGYEDTPYGLLVVVCDGMGGGPAGKTASTIAVREIIHYFLDTESDDTASNRLVKAIRCANMAIIEASNENHTLKGMGSTCAALLLNERAATLAYVGDSRIYQFRGKKRIYRTFDHSMVFDLVKQKVITEEQARLSAQSNVITRALGTELDIKVDVIELSYEKRDRFLLCTDRIHGAMPETELIAMATNPKAALGQMVDEIATRIDGEGRRLGGGHDNLTLAILETKINSTIVNKMNKRYKILIIILLVICALSIGCNFYLLFCQSSPTIEKVENSVVVPEPK